MGDWERDGDVHRDRKTEIQSETYTWGMREKREIERVRDTESERQSEGENKKDGEK